MVSLDLAGFTTASGKRVPSTACKVVTTPARHTCVTVEATGSMLDWLVQACSIDWQVEASELFQVCAPPVVPKRALPDHLPELNQPLSYILRGQPAIAVAYKTESGWKRKQRKIEDLLGDDIEANNQIVANVPSLLVEFYNVNHHHTAHDDAGPEDAVVTEGNS